MRNLTWGLSAFAALAVLTACDHKDLCFNHPEHASRYDTRFAATYDLTWETTGPEGTDWKAA